MFLDGTDARIRTQTPWLTATYAHRLRHIGICSTYDRCLAGEAGFEPTFTESESGVLPIERLPNVDYSV